MNENRPKRPRVAPSCTDIFVYLFVNVLTRARSFRFRCQSPDGEWMLQKPLRRNQVIFVEETEMEQRVIESAREGARE